MAGEEDFNVLTEDEEAALKTEPKSDDTETPPEEPGETKVEPSPPESKVEPEPQPKVEPEPQPAPEPKIDGILAKDGKNIIPFNVLERERTEKQALRAELEALKAKTAQPTPPPKVEPKPSQETTIEDVAKSLGIDFKGLATKAIESEEGLADVLKTMFIAGAKVASQVASKAGSQAGSQSAFNATFQSKVEAIKAKNDWLTGPAEDLAVILAKQKAAANPKFNPDSLDDLVRVAEEGVEEAKKLLKIGSPVIDEAKIRAEEREKTTKDVMAKLNITPMKNITLTGARNVSPEVGTKLDHVDTLTGLDLEDAVANLTPQEREALLVRQRG